MGMELLAVPVTGDRTNVVMIVVLTVLAVAAVAAAVVMAALRRKG